MHARPWIVVAVSLVSACSMGPEFQRPSPPASDRYTAGPEPRATAAAAGEGGLAQHFVSGAEVPGHWWESFRCPALNALIEEALAHSPTALEARARLRQAQEDLTAERRGALYPSVDAQLETTRERINPVAFGFSGLQPPPFTLYNAQVNVSYTLDLFGANRHMLEGAQAQAEYQSFETKAAQLTLAANVVAAAIRQADLQAQIGYTRQLLVAQTRQLAIGAARYRAGGIALEDLQNQRTQLEQLRATLPALQAQRQQVDHQLAVYTGKSPAEAAIARFGLKDLQLPTEVPVALPSELVRRRPDVRASEALWHQAAANLGVATANLFPNLTLAASAGSERTRASDLVDSLNVWSIGAALLQPIFRAGELQAKRRSAVAAYEAAAHGYEQTVLESLQQVADSLRVLAGDAAALKARSTAAAHADAGYAIARARFDEGGISELALLDAQRQQLQTELDRSHAEAQRFADTAALLHALAGAVSAS